MNSRSLFWIKLGALIGTPIICTTINIVFIVMNGSYAARFLGPVYGIFIGLIGGLVAFILGELVARIAKVNTESKLLTTYFLVEGITIALVILVTALTLPTPES